MSRCPYTTLIIAETNDPRNQKCETSVGFTSVPRALTRSGVPSFVRGGARVVGRQDRETILCVHTMDEHSLARLWPVILSRLAKAGLAVVPQPETPQHDEA